MSGENKEDPNIHRSLIADNRRLYENNTRWKDPAEVEITQRTLYYWVKYIDGRYDLIIYRGSFCVPLFGYLTNGDKYRVIGQTDVLFFEKDFGTGYYVPNCYNFGTIAKPPKSFQSPQGQFLFIPHEPVDFTGNTLVPIDF